MGFLRGIYEKRTDEWAGHNAEFLAGDELPSGHTRAGQKITCENSLQITTVYKCVNKISKTLASLPYNVYQYLPGGGKEKAPDHHLQSVIHTRANRLMTAMDFRRAMQGSYLLWGNAYAQIIRNGLGQIIELWPFMPDRMKVEIIKNRMVYEYTYKNGSTKIFQEKDVWHLRDFSIDGLVGLSKISQERECLGLAKATERFGSKFFGNTAKATGLLRHPNKLSDSARDNLKKSVKEQISGENILGMFVIEEGMEWQQISIPPDDAQFLETRKYQDVDICGIFDISPTKVWILDRATYSNIEHLSIEFVTDTLLSDIIYWEQKADYELLPEGDRGKYFTKHVLDGLLRGDTTARGEFYSKMFNNASLSPNDIRELEDKNPYKGGEKYYVPLNMIPVESAGKANIIQEKQPDGTERIYYNPQKNIFNELLKDKDVREGYDEFKKSVITPTQTRSIQGRKRLAEVNKRLFEDAVSRIVGMENIAITRAVKKYIIHGMTNDFMEWLNDYYARMPESIEKNMLSIFMAYADAVQIEANQEIGNEPGMTPEYERFVADYEGVYAFNYINSSKNQIGKIVREAKADEDVSGLIIARIDEWREKRPVKEASRQVVESSSAFSKAIYLAAGVMSLKWVAAGSKPCPYCLEMNGRIVGIHSNFVGKGEQLNPEGGTGPMLSYENKSHPPLHGGCECIITAVI